MIGHDKQVTISLPTNPSSGISETGQSETRQILPSSNPSVYNHERQKHSAAAVTSAHQISRSNSENSTGTVASSPLSFSEEIISNSRATSNKVQRIISSSSPANPPLLSRHFSTTTKSSNRVTVNVTIATQPDSSVGNETAPSSSSAAVYVLSVSVPASGGQPNVNIIQHNIQPPPHKVIQDVVNPNLQMMNDVQVPEMFNEDVTIDNVTEKHRIVDDGMKDCDCRIQDRDIESYLKQKNASIILDGEQGCTVLVQQSTTPTPTTPPPLSNDVLDSLQGERRD